MKIKDCIFCKICTGKAPSYTVYEDDLVKAFFDIYPASECHTLVVPKKHYHDIYDIPEKELKQIIVVLKRLADVYKKALDVKAVNVLHASGKAAQQDVFHFHMHLVPRREGDRINLWHRGKNLVKKDFEMLQKKRSRSLSLKQK